MFKKKISKSWKEVISEKIDTDTHSAEIVPLG